MDIIIKKIKLKYCGHLYGETKIIILLGQINNNENYDLTSWLTEKEYKELILSVLPQQTSAYLDLTCYNLISTHKLTAHLPKLNKNVFSNSKNSIQISNSSLSDALKLYNGLLYFHCHLDQYSWEYIEKAVNELQKGSVDYCYLELPSIIFGPAFDIFNKNGNSTLLLKHLNATILAFPQINKFFVKLSEACFRKKIKVIPVDMLLALDSTLTSATMIERDEFIAKNILNNIQPGTKFIGLFGAKHVNIARILNVPSIGIIHDALDITEDFSYVIKSTAPKSAVKSLCTCGIFAIAAATAGIVLASQYWQQTAGHK